MHSFWSFWAQLFFDNFQIFLFLFQMLLFKVCIGIVCPFICFCTVLWCYSIKSLLLAAYMLTFQHCHSITMTWFVPDGWHHHMPCWWLIVYYHQTSGFCWWNYFLNIHSYRAEMWVSLQRLTSTCPNWCHSVTPSFLAIYPKHTTLCFVFWCLKKGLRVKCLRGTSDVLRIVPVLKKIHKGSQSVTPSRLEMHR